MMPVSGSASLKALAVLTASWPCMASTTNSVSTGFSAACSSLISRISTSSIARRPAVSTSSTSKYCLRAWSSAARAMSSRLLVGRAGEPLGAGLLRHRLELLDGGRPVDVARHGQHLLLALLDQVLGQLGGGGGLAGALQAGHQDHRRRLRRQVDVGDALAHGGGQFAVDDADQRLARLERAQHFLAQRLFLDAGDEVAHHRQRDVGLEQGHAHFAQHVLHVVFGDAGLAAHLLDEAGEFVGEGGWPWGWCRRVGDGPAGRARSAAREGEGLNCEP